MSTPQARTSSPQGDNEGVDPQTPSTVAQLYPGSQDPQHKDRQKQYDAAGQKLSTYRVDQVSNAFPGRKPIAWDNFFDCIMYPREFRDLVAEKPDQVFTWLKKVMSKCDTQEKIIVLLAQALNESQASVERLLEENRHLDGETEGLNACRASEAKLVAELEELQSTHDKLWKEKADAVRERISLQDEVKQLELDSDSSKKTLRATIAELKAANDKIDELEEVIRSHDDSKTAVHIVDGIKINSALEFIQSDKAIKDPPEFDGTRFEYRSWLSKVRTKMNALIYPSMEYAMRTVLSWTSGGAFRDLDARLSLPWIKRDGIFKTATDMFAFMNETYDIADRREAFHALDGLTQGEDTFSEFIAKWNKYAAYRTVPDGYAIAEISMKLDRDFYMRVLTTGAMERGGSVDEFVKVCKTVERNLRFLRVDETVNEESTQVRAATNLSQRSPMPEKYTKLKKLTAEDRATMKREGRCMRCREQGHTQWEYAECPMRAEYEGDGGFSE